jgi:hypothetical protein
LRLRDAVLLGLDDLLCLPIWVRIVMLAREPVALVDLSKLAGDETGAYRHQALRLQKAKYVRIYRGESAPYPSVVETTALGRERLAQHVEAMYTIMRDLGLPAVPPRLSGGRIRL